MMSMQAQLVLVMGLIISVLSLYKYSDYKLTFIQIVTFYFFASDINCKIYGGCYVGSMITMILPTLIFLIFLFYYLGIFNNLKKKFKNIYKKLA